MIRRSSKIVKVFLIISLCFSHVFDSQELLADNTPPPTPSTSNTADQIELKTPVKKAAHPTQHSRAVSDVHESITGESLQTIDLPEHLFPSVKDQRILKLFYEGMTHAHKTYRKKLKEFGGDKGQAVAAFLVDVNRDLVIHRSEFGQTEITLLDGQLCARVVYAPTNENVVFLGTSLETDHAEMFKARLRYNRQSAFHVIEDHQINNSLELSVPESLREKWEVYKKAVYVKPTKQQIRFAFVVGSLQVAALQGYLVLKHYVGSTKLKTGSDSSSEIFLMSGLSFVLGTFRGVYGRTFKNWELTFSTPVTSYLKQSAFGIFSKYLYYTLKYTIIDGTGIQPFFKPIDFANLHHNTHYHIFTNTAFSSANKSGWFSLPSLWESLGRGRENVRFKFLGREFNLGINQNQLNFQLVYLIPFLASKLDLIYEADGRGILLVSMGIGLVLNESILRVIQFRAIRRAKRTGLQEDIEYKDKVNAFIKLRVDYAKKKVKPIYDKIKDTHEKLCKSPFLI